MLSLHGLPPNIFFVVAREVTAKRRFWRVGRCRTPTSRGYVWRRRALYILCLASWNGTSARTQPPFAARSRPCARHSHDRDCLQPDGPGYPQIGDAAGANPARAANKAAESAMRSGASPPRDHLRQRRRRQLLEDGEADAAANWHRILDAIERLQAQQPTDGEGVH